MKRVLFRPDKSWSSEAILKYWIAERTRIYEARRAGYSWPWSEDPIFQAYRFTNVSRHLDRTTQFLRQSLDKLPIKKQLFCSVAFRAYNRINTWEVIRDAVVPNYDKQKVLKLLHGMGERAEAITSGCWLVVGAKNRKMYESQLDPLDMCWHNLGEYFAARRSLENMHAKLKELPRIGAFIGQEILMDLTYETRILERAMDRKGYVYLGPGSIRFLRGARKDKSKVNTFAEHNDPEDIKHFWKIVKSNTAHRLDNGYRLTVHDVEHCLCETYKYIRAMHGEYIKRRYVLGE